MFSQVLEMMVDLGFISLEKQFFDGTLEGHLNGFKNAYVKDSKQILTDACYGSEENYQMLNQKEIAVFIPYNMYRIEQTRKNKKKLFHAQNLF